MSSPFDEIGSLIDRHGRAVLQFSGGKDSTALLYLARPYLDRITVYFADTGATYPHVVRFVHETCIKLGARLMVVKPAMDVHAYTAVAGLPVDILPVERTQDLAPMLREKPAQLLQSYLRCCSAMLWHPMAQAIKESCATLVLRGSKKADARVGVASGHVEAGITYASPLWDWSDDDVMAYLAQEGVTLPAHYAAVPDSLDCWSCTAHLAHHGAAKLRWTREHYPDLWPEISRRLQAVKGALDAETARVAEAFSEAGV